MSEKQNKSEGLLNASHGKVTNNLRGDPISAVYFSERFFLSLICTAGEVSFSITFDILSETGEAGDWNGVSSAIVILFISLPWIPSIISGGFGKRQDNVKV